MIPWRKISTLEKRKRIVQYDEGLEDYWWPELKTKDDVNVMFKRLFKSQRWWQQDAFEGWRNSTRQLVEGVIVGVGLLMFICGLSLLLK